MSDQSNSRIPGGFFVGSTCSSRRKPGPFGVNCPTERPGSSFFKRVIFWGGINGVFAIGWFGSFFLREANRAAATVAELVMIAAMIVSITICALAIEWASRENSLSVER